MRRLTRPFAVVRTGTSADADHDAELATESGLRAAYGAHGPELYRFALRQLGDEHAAQDVVQEVFLRAWRAADSSDPAMAGLRVWLFAIARNAVIDELRRSGARPWQHSRTAEWRRTRREGCSGPRVTERWTCCAGRTRCASSCPRWSSLKTVGGLGVNEIAAALLTQPATVAQRLARAKRWLRARADPLELPGSDTLGSRVDSVLAVLYLLFNEGYDATTGQVAVRGELCGEAIRLGRLLLADRRTDTAAARALLALMLLQASRLPARVDASGEVLLLAEQDRSRWDRGLIGEGTRAFAAACTGAEMSAYHVEAAIALCHAATQDPAETDWPRILALYDQLLQLRDSPVIRLNRAIALAMTRTPADGIVELARLEAHPQLVAYTPLPASLGALWLRAGEPARAAECYRRALSMPAAEPQRRFLQRRLAECQSQSPCRGSQLHIDA